MPPIPDNAEDDSALESYNKAEYPHWHVFRVLHQGTTISLDSLKPNAEIIAKIPVDELIRMELEDFEAAGVHIERSDYWD